MENLLAANIVIASAPRFSDMKRGSTGSLDFGIEQITPVMGRTIRCFACRHLKWF